MMTEYFIHLLVLIGIYTILAVSLNLALGYTGLLNLGHVALFGVGAYASALSALKGTPFLIALILAGLIASVFGFILIHATKKLKGDYYALAALGFAFVVYSLFVNLTWLTNGPKGIPGIPRPDLFGFVIADNTMYLFFVLIIALISVFLMWKLAKSPFGRLLEAMRDDEISLRVLGKDTSKLKYKVLMVSGFFAGVAGSLFAHYINFVDPSSFYLLEIIFVLTIVIVGGIASTGGAIAATFILILIPELLRFLSLPSAIMGPARQIIYAVILVAIIMFRPRGLFGRVDLE